MMHEAVTALSTATVGLGAATWGVIAQVNDSTGGIGPWAQVGGIATAVGALAYVAKLLADGRLVAHPVHQIIEAQAQREKRLEDLVEDSHEREQMMWKLIMKTAPGPER